MIRGLQWLNLTGVKVSKDLRHAKVFFSLLGGGGDQQEASGRAQKRRRIYSRRELGKKLDLRFVPAIEFLYDDSEEEARRIDALLDKVKELKRKIEGFLSDFIS